MAGKEFWKGLLIGICGTVFAAAGGFMGYRRAALPAENTVLADREHVKKLEYLEALIDTYYLEEKDEEELAEGLYTGLLYGLGDPYSRYYTKEEYEEENTSTEGAYVGIGIVMQKNSEGGMRIVKCYEGGPGEAAGLKEGDIISAVDGEDVTEAETTAVVGMIRDSDAENTVLTIHRENVEEPLLLTVPITDVELPSVFHEMLEEKTGYIRITEFKGVTPEQYKKAFEELEGQGMEKLVVDLRNNPGGLLTSVSDVLRQILPEGLIVYTEDKYGKREEVTCDGENPLEMPLAVLINEYSASASEIFAGAVQDYGIGTLVGTTTYGKGIVQSLRMLGDGSAVKLTVSKYFTPKGNHIHETGIQPDVEVRPDVSLLNKDEITHEEDNQLQAALLAVEQDSAQKPEAGRN